MPARSSTPPPDPGSAPARTRWPEFRHDDRSVVRGSWSVGALGDARHRRQRVVDLASESRLAALFSFVASGVKRPNRGAAWVLGACAVSAAAAAGAAGPDLSRLPPAAPRPVVFATDIQPILEKACLRCHGPERPKGGFRLDDEASALRSGESGPAIIPGNSAGSPLIHFVAGLVPDSEMPPAGKGDPLTPTEVGLLRAWIDQGARWSAAAAEPKLEFSVTPAIQFVSVDGNAARFREHYWMREGWGGGATDFSLKYDTDARTRVEIDGRALAGPDDYRFRARIERDDLGWTRLEYREFSRWQDDTGGYYAPFGTPAPRWGDDFVLRHRQATAEFGLTLPDWPKLRLAYDVHLREGTEATLNWGAVTVGGTSRAIYPGRKRVDETTHLISLDVAYDWDGLLISDEAQFEWHEQDNRRWQRDTVPPPFDFSTLVTDRQDYWRGANVLRLERSLRDWLYVSGGYLYSQLRDVGGFSVESFAPSDPTLPPSLDMSADDLTLRRQSHVVNGNAMLGPWEQLHFYAGLQAEWTRQEGFAAGQTYGTATAYDADTDRAATDENFGLRYAGIPWTVRFRRNAFPQETYSQFEEGLADAQQAFLRDTDAEADTRDYEAGFHRRAVAGGEFPGEGPPPVTGPTTTRARAISTCCPVATGTRRSSARATPWATRWKGAWFSSRCGG